MRIVSGIVAGLIIWLWSVPCLAQEPSDRSCGSCPPAKVADQLTQRHIPLTKDALLEALHSHDPKIRDLAASQLADEGDKSTIPAIVEALAAERVPMARVNMAFSLALMGDERGIQSLRQDCNDGSLQMNYRLTAALDLAMFLHDESCWRTVVEGAQSTETSDVRVQALSLIPDFKKSSPDQTAMFRALLLNGLRDDDAGVRMEASYMLEMMGDVSAIPALQEAIAAETEPGVRSSMENDLRILKKKRS